MLWSHSSAFLHVRITWPIDSCHCFHLLRDLVAPWIPAQGHQDPNFQSHSSTSINISCILNDFEVIVVNVKHNLNIDYMTECSPGMSCLWPAQLQTLLTIRNHTLPKWLATAAVHLRALKWDLLYRKGWTPSCWSLGLFKMSLVRYSTLNCFWRPKSPSSFSSHVFIFCRSQLLSLQKKDQITTKRSFKMHTHCH